MSQCHSSSLTLSDDGRAEDSEEANSPFGPAPAIFEGLFPIAAAISVAESVPEKGSVALRFE